MRAMFSAVMIAVMATLPGPAQAGEGVLDKDLIRRVVRAHIDEVRYCYNAGLEKDPDLAGKIVVGFEIGADGAVQSSEITESTLPDAEVGTCVAAAVKKWVFPKPQGGSVAVAYPFVLEPG